MIYEGSNGIYNSPALSAQLDKEAKEKRDEMRDLINGTKRNPVLKKEQHKPHPNEPKQGKQ